MLGLCNSFFRASCLPPPSPHLDLAHGVEAVKLVEQLKHGPLDLTLAAAVRVVTLGPDRIDLV